jgi:hypothetical protein
MIVPEIKEPVALEPEWLMNLKIKTDCFFA